MAAYFFDSSALVNCYIVETGTSWTRAISADQDNIIHVSSLARVEITSALTRRLRKGHLTQAEFDLVQEESQFDLANEYEVVGFTDHLISEAVRLALKHGLRAYDAVQLATAMFMGKIVSQVASEELILVSADDELNAAAVAEDLQIENPNAH